MTRLSAHLLAYVRNMLGQVIESCGAYEDVEMIAVFKNKHQINLPCLRVERCP